MPGSRSRVKRHEPPHVHTSELAQALDTAALTRRCDSKFVTGLDTRPAFIETTTASLAVAPRHVDNPPAVARLQQLEEIDVQRAANGGARDPFRHVVDFDLDPAIVDVLSLSSPLAVMSIISRAVSVRMLSAPEASCSRDRLASSG